MKVLRHYENTPEEFKGGVVVLGNFDGVHRGHQRVIWDAGQIAQEANVPLIVMTFEPHPRNYFSPDEAPFRLTPFRNKTHQLEALGIDALVVLNFDDHLSSMGAEEFIREVLVKGAGASHVVVGYDFCFGKGRTGTPALMREMNKFDVTAINPVTSPDQEIYSSSRIRNYLKSGKPGHAAAILGRPFEVEARIEAGAQMGRTIGFPTANVELGDYLRPLYGVYAVRAGVELDGKMQWFDAIANLGKRPTVDGLTELLEVHLFEFSNDIYGHHLRVAFIEFIRPEEKFDGLDKLKAQIEADCLVAKQILHTRAAGAT